MSSIRTAAEIVFPIENQSNVLCQGLDDWLKREYIHQINLKNSDLACSELMVREDAETTP